MHRPTPTRCDTCGQDFTYEMKIYWSALDGRTRATTTTGADATGRAVHEVIVYERK